ncbi:MAG: N-6 DNA methylase [Candidatus Kapabacteria bacterium]|nr:N-6 DNA methylase [Candidatus Kapabacteria bacterium]
MSLLLIDKYYKEVDNAKKLGKSLNETSIRNYFWMLLNNYAEKFKYSVIAEIPILGKLGKRVIPDGTVRNTWGLDVGYWESKDEKTNLDAEIQAKIDKGYPLNNILFEDGATAVLYQNGTEAASCKIRNAAALDKLLTQFFSYKSEVVYQFETAIEHFKADIPIIIETLREKIDKARQNNSTFIQVQNEFWLLCQKEINPDITLDDIREMMIQHILTSDIFNRIFDDPNFHQHNTIAAELERLISALFDYAKRRNLLDSISHYYEAINATAAGIIDHHEKQKFLKVVYENFYKVYNPKAADKLGVIYTPNEIVQFMVSGANQLLFKHFGKSLADPNVDILDPATGTGTFICEIIENAIPAHQLEYKYKQEIHANEVAILPYYIANLNIEFTFKQKMNYYCEFPNLCFVDTLDNIGGLNYKGQHIPSKIGLTHENALRIQRQNEKKISVIIGNPPYNANQMNENENNKNRSYPAIDKRIKDTFIHESTAQKTKMYDMYARFYRWAMDRIGDDGIIAFITNRSFIDSRTFDGFRKTIEKEFDYAYIIDLGGNIRANNKNDLGNVFGIMVGVAIMFLVKDRENNKCRIKYHKIEGNKKEDKLEKLKYYSTVNFNNIQFENITPDAQGNWFKVLDNDWKELNPTIDKTNKLSKKLINKNVLFQYYSNGCVTARDEWVYDFDKFSLINKINYFLNEYNNFVDLWKNKISNENLSNEKKDEILKKAADFVFKNNTTIKWSGRLFRDKLTKFRKTTADTKFITNCLYRPFSLRYIYYDYIPIDIHGQFKFFIFKDKKNCFITYNGPNNIIFDCLASKYIVDFGLFYGDTQCLPLYTYDSEGNRHDNITDWGLAQFREHYADLTIEKEDIFHYVYGVLHNSEYRKKYELNLKREFPRIPFYADFWQWAKWGQKLMDLHINFEEVEPYGLKRHDIEWKLERLPKAKLRADKEAGTIELDEQTYLSGVPKLAWEYKLGNRSALEWILDQYKEKKPKDPTIAEKFNTYKFADYKEKVIDLLNRITTVSVRTMEIMQEMEKMEQ